MKIKVPKWSRACNENEKRELIMAARRYIGVPWRHLGRSTHCVDCAGLLIVTAYDIMGVWIEITDYSPWPNQFVMRDMCNRILIPIKREYMAPGDVALLYAPGLGVVHLGWFTGKTLIHANNEPHAGKVVETTIHPDWNLRGTYAVPMYEVVR